MPTYEYECQSCSHVIELFQSFSETPKRKCPKCGKLKLQRLISGGVGVVFKGKGFYVTDNRSSTQKKKVPPKDVKSPKANDSKKTPSKKAE